MEHACFCWALLKSYMTTLRPSPPPSPNHKQGWTGVSRIFLEFPLYIGWGEGEPQDFSERLIALFYDSTRKLQKIISTALLTQGLFSWIVDSATAESFMSENSYVIYLFIFSSFFFAIKTVPSENVALPSLGASVIEGVSRSRNALLNGEVGNYDWNIGYTCHQLGSGAIVVQLPQPYIIGSMR